MNGITKFFAKTAVSAARSLLLSEVKGSVKSFISKKKAKTIDDVRREMMQSVGYVTQHFKLDKQDNIVYKSSPIFMHEWLFNSPSVKEKIIRDEESGHIYIDNELITNTKKLDLLDKFVNSTGVKAASLSSHLDNALKLIDVSDFNAVKFKEHFAGWQPDRESVIDNWINNCFGHMLVTDQEYAKMLFRKWIIGTARRAINPGTSFDGCLVLKGPGGAGKTLHFRYLLPEPFNTRTGEIYCNIKSPQKFVEAIKGKTIACFDELSILEHQQAEETFKQLLSSQFIDVRLAWAREPRRFALRAGFSGTTNKAKFIPDQFLSRRLWTIELNNNGRLNFDYLHANRFALWQEALFLANTKEPCTLSFDEQKLVEANNTTYLLDD